jgi:subtilase family serine protease
MQVANTTEAPLVTSISYGDSEKGYFNKFGSYVYIDRMNAELMKMAARGLTVVAGSGDAGVSNVGEAGNDISPTYGECAPFSPFFPSNSQYVLSTSSTFFTTLAKPMCGG